MAKPSGTPQAAYVLAKALEHIHRPCINRDVAPFATDDEYHFSLDFPCDGSDVGVMDQVTPTKIRYIKLGAGGSWEGALDHGRIEWGNEGDSHVAGLATDWTAVRQGYVDQGRLPATATGYTNEARAFYDDDPQAMWVTFARGRMWWAFAEPGVCGPAGGGEAGAALYRVARGGWSDCDVAGATLTAERLSTRLTQLQGYQRSICGLSADQDALCRRYVNATLDPTLAAVAAAQADLRHHVHALIQQLTWHDFEQLIDLVLARTGWIRSSDLGGTMKDVDLIVEQSFTGERMSVQIKSSADQQVVDDYARRLATRAAGERIMLICHSPIGTLTAPQPGMDRGLELILGAKIADVAIKAGLVDWITARAL